MSDQTYATRLNNILNNLDVILMHVGKKIPFNELNSNILNYQEFNDVIDSINKLMKKIQLDSIDNLIDKPLSEEDAKVEIYKRLIEYFKDSPQALKSIRSAKVKNLPIQDLINRAIKFEDASSDLITACRLIEMNIIKDDIIEDVKPTIKPVKWYTKFFTKD